MLVKLHFIASFFFINQIYYLFNDNYLLPSLLIVSLTFVLISIKSFSLKNLNHIEIIIPFSIVILNCFLFSLNPKTFSPFYNDIIRLTIIMSLFLSIRSYYRHPFNILIFLSRFAKISIIYHFLICIYQFFNYEEFEYFITSRTVDVSSLMQWGGVRISGTIRDSNTLSYILILLCYVIYITRNLDGNNKYFSIINYKIYFLLSLSLITLSGSRMAILIIFLLFLINIPKFNSKYIIALTFIICIGVYLTLQGYILQRLNPFNIDQMTANAVSNNERLESNLSGFSYILKHFWSPVGNIHFRSSWSSWSDSYHFPHSTLIYILCEIGFLTFIIFFPVVSRILKLDRNQFTIMCVPIFFLPGAIYYPIIYLSLMVSSLSSSSK